MIGTMLEPFNPEVTELMLHVQQSYIGKQLEVQSRYERYLEVPGGVSQFALSPEEQAAWSAQQCSKIYDADVNNLYHHTFTALLNLAACRIDNVDEYTTWRTTRNLMVHDVKEVRFSAADEGDLTYDDAHAHGAAGFHGEHRDLREMLTSDDFPQFTDETAAEVEADMNDSKLPEPETIFGQRIEIAERLGYIQSGANAAERAGKMLDAAWPEIPPEFSKTLWMAENCFANSLERMIALAAIHESVQVALVGRGEKIARGIFMATIYQDQIADHYRETATADQNREAIVEQRQQKFHGAVNSLYQSTRPNGVLAAAA